MPMHSLTALAYMHLHGELYNSSLLISEYLLNHGVDPSDAYYIAAKSFFSLGHSGKLMEMCRAIPEILNDKRIYLLYLRQGGSKDELANIRSQASEMVPTEYLSKPDCNKCEIMNYSDNNLHNFDHTALSLLFSALNETNHLRKRLLILSFIKDPCLIEPLVCLFQESLFTFHDFFDFIDNNSEWRLSYNSAKINNMLVDDYKLFIQSLFSVSTESLVISPLKTYLRTVQYLKTNISGSELFRYSIGLLEELPNSAFSSLSLGIYYLMRGRLKEAKKPLYRAIKLDSNLGIGYLFTGLMHSQRREVERAINMLSTALNIMDGSVLPPYYLAFEYQKINNYSKAKYFYKKALKIIEEKRERENKIEKQNETIGSKRSKRIGEENKEVNEKDEEYRFNYILCSYVYCLLYNEEYDEALGMIQKYKIRNLLKVYALLFTGNIEGARESLEICEESYRKCGMYYATKGYLAHLIGEFEMAQADYEKATYERYTSTVEELLALVAVNMTGVETNRAFDYVNSLFDLLEYNQSSLELAKACE